VRDSTAGRIETWSEVNSVKDGIVSYSIHYLFVDSGEEVIAPSRLRFRTRVELTRSLTEAGFTIECVNGDWDRRPADPRSRELIFVAAR
jgi:hypothetical protein